MYIYIDRKRKFIAFAIPAIALVLTAVFSTAVFLVKNKGIKLPIIMYHSIGLNTGKYVISPEQLDEDLQYIKKQGYETVNVADLIRYVSGEGTLPEKPIMLTFDDGYYDNYLFLLPILKKYNMKAVISVVGSFADSAGEKNVNGMMNWMQLYELQQSGLIEIQNHSYALHEINAERMGSMISPGESREEYAKVFMKDTMRMQQRAEELLGTEMTAYTYPYGFVGKYSENMLKQMGFHATFSCADGINCVTHNPKSLFLMKRFNRPAGENSREYFERIGAR